jgi:sugar O-acyltransferase (sialic acid O-acetyltransferase NeuD family)
MLDLVIIGAGGVGREMLSLVEEINLNSFTYNCLGFLDDQKPKGTLVNNKPIIGSIDLNNLEKISEINFIVAIGNPTIRKEVFNKIGNLGGILPNIIHPLARIDKHVSTNLSSVNGNIICYNASIGCNVSMGDNNFVNMGAIIGHDTIIGSHNVIMQTSVLNGEIEVRDECFIGPGVVLNGVVKIPNKEKIVRA